MFDKGRLFTTSLFVVIAGLAACGERICTTAGRPAVAVEVRDSITGAAAGHRASLILQGESVYDSMYWDALKYVVDTSRFSVLYSAPNGRPGIYTVRVRRPGYQLWQRSDVYVDGDRCGAAIPPLQLSARLQRNN